MSRRRPEGAGFGPGGKPMDNDKTGYQAYKTQDDNNLLILLIHYHHRLFDIKIIINIRKNEAIVAKLKASSKLLYVIFLLLLFQLKFLKISMT